MEERGIKTIYHLVPKYIYDKSITRLGNYNCKGFENSNFIHTTAGLKEMKRVGDLIFTKAIKNSENSKSNGKFYEKPSVEFLILVIDKSKVKSKMSLIKQKYYHIYGSIPKESYKIRKVKRDKQGKFYF